MNHKVTLYFHWLLLASAAKRDANGRAHVPARARHGEQRAAAAPAVRVGVLQRVLAEEQAGGLEPARDVLVAILDEAADERAAEVAGAGLGREAALVVHRLEQRHARRPEALAQREVVGAEGRRGVHEAGAVRFDDRVPELVFAVLVGVLAGGDLAVRIVDGVAAVDPAGAVERGFDVTAAGVDDLLFVRDDGSFATPLVRPGRHTIVAHTESGDAREASALTIDLTANFRTANQRVPLKLAPGTCAG